MLSDGGNFLDVNRLDFKKYSRFPALAKALMDFILYHDHNPKKALELGSEATKTAEFKDWWWKARLGKCYYQLGMFRDAEKQFQSALKQQEMISTYLELSKIPLRLDQPNQALVSYFIFNFLILQNSPRKYMPKQLKSSQEIRYYCLDMRVCTMR